MHLEEIIIQKIKESGPISFHDYMEMCLYYPSKGYYTSHTERIGQHGDFYTSSSISSVVGAVIGRQLEEMWEKTGREEFSIVEYGAGTGRLCHDILDHLKNSAAFYERLTYYIIEKSPSMRSRQSSFNHEKVKWIDSIDKMAAFTGCVLSNELLDNFAVHRVIMEDQLMEVYVDHKDGNFTESLQPAGSELVDYFQRQQIVLPTGHRTEVNLEAIQWLGEIATSMKKGYVLTIDYGHQASDLYNEKRKEGTLLCFHKHQINDKPFTNIGDQDITSHVNFTALSTWGESLGLQTCGFVTQADFLQALGWEKLLMESVMGGAPDYTKYKQYAFLKYTMLMDMGQKFKVLLQSKRADRELRGCQYALRQEVEGRPVTG
ncbi:MAG: SAM-dependent methyltransferase [Chitinophagaceae bacterium]|nr:SAM-dependent methyltransferase [Chitinophagaceae bacterium]